MMQSKNQHHHHHPKKKKKKNTSYHNKITIKYDRNISPSEMISLLFFFWGKYILVFLCSFAEWKIFHKTDSQYPVKPLTDTINNNIESIAYRLGIYFFWLRDGVLL